jgi:hypothetical protein
MLSRTVVFGSITDVFFEGIFLIFPQFLFSLQIQLPPWFVFVLKAPSSVQSLPDTQH